MVWKRSCRAAMITTPPIKVRITAKIVPLPQNPVLDVGIGGKGVRSFCYSEPVLPKFQPMPLLKRRSAFDDPSWIFELKYDGFRALAIIDRGRAKLISLKPDGCLNSYLDV